MCVWLALLFSALFIDLYILLKSERGQHVDEYMKEMRENDRL